jgi:nitroimidazol reductase NimA-like FMN-containing flavoprotein (pyridoxamine 5'-phosphate oxidase superfamily)
MLRRLSDDEKTALLLRQRLGRLGCVVGGVPYVVPINYVFDGENVYSHSLPGTKIDALRLNPGACLQVDEIRDEFHWQSVMVVGEYQEIASDQERDIVLAKLLARLPSLTPVESFHEHDAPQPAPVVFQIRIREISGVRES